MLDPKIKVNIKSSSTTSLLRKTTIAHDIQNELNFT